LGNRGSEDNKVSRKVWKTMETSAEKIGLGRSKRKKLERRERKNIRRENGKKRRQWR